MKAVFLFLSVVVSIRPLESQAARSRAATFRVESIAGLEPGVWTRMKIVVSASRAELYVNGAEQPSLVVNDFKAGVARGRLALWIGPGTDGYFSSLTVR